jgi:putative GTP pyrophosphokinase
MKYRPNDIDRIAKLITQRVEEDFANSGIFYRIFFRCKSSGSLNEKLETKNLDGSLKYDGRNKFLRDIIGIRVNLYFVDDLEIVTEFIQSKYKSLFEEETIDENNTTEFKPTRINLIFKVPTEFLSEFRGVIKDQRIDSTFELQLRTVLSEGWHEVEHDLRYKCQSDWDPYPEMSRMFNGYLAALETQEWSMLQLFNQISYNHYKNDNLSALIRTKLRIRFTDDESTPRVASLIQDSDAFRREFFKLDRGRIIRLLLNGTHPFPLSFDNIIYLINYCFIRDENILASTPEFILSSLKGCPIPKERPLGFETQ